MMSLMILLRLFVFLTMTSLGKTEVERFEDVVLSSIESVAVATLNEAVSNFVLQLAEISKSLSEVKRNQEQTKKSLDSLEQKFLHLEQERLLVIDDKVDALNVSLSVAVKRNQEQTKKSLDSLEQKILHLEQEQEKLSVLDEQVDTLSVSLSVANVRIDNSREVMIVSGEQAPGYKECMKVCAGSTGRTTTDWTNYSSDGIFYDVDISDCGFKTIPTVTTAVEGAAGHWVSLGTSSIYNTSPSAFRIYLKNTYSNQQGGLAEKHGTNVEWIAVGYTC